MDSFDIFEYAMRARSPTKSLNDPVPVSVERHTAACFEAGPLLGSEFFAGPTIRRTANDSQVD